MTPGSGSRQIAARYDPAVREAQSPNRRDPAPAAQVAARAGGDRLRVLDVFVGKRGAVAAEIWPAAERIVP